jgi:hypothetical protein
MGGSIGWPSGSPLIAARPLIDSAIVAKPGRLRYGPVCPKPVTRVTTSRRFQRARPEVLDEDVGVVDEAEEHVAVGGVLEVEDDRALVAVRQLPPQAFAVARVAPGEVAQRVASGPLHLDHVGPVVGQVAGAVRAGDDRRQVEHLEVGERRVHARRL